jgi:hypothetical protein
VAKLIAGTRPDGSKRLLFFCPGCKNYHEVTVVRGSEYKGPVWEWDGNMEKPTFSPSILCNQGTDLQCHLFVHDGMIQYLGDCVHELRLQTVEMEEVE